jgi:endoglycosylceramidase
MDMALLLVLLLALFVAPAHADDPADVVGAQGGVFVDARGGQVLLRGGNVIRKSTGEPQIDARDIEVMRQIGWTTIRLGTGWRWFEPERGVYDAAYADRFAAIARQLTDAGFRVVVDMHQDVWGPPVGNGNPQWAVPAEPTASRRT